ncbi:hypothetical protein D3C73_1524420 [compost metagenome]
MYVQHGLRLNVPGTDLIIRDMFGDHCTPVQMARLNDPVADVIRGDGRRCYFIRDDGFVSYRIRCHGGRRHVLRADGAGSQLF